MDLIWISSLSPQFSQIFVRFCSILWVPWSTADFMLIWRLSRESLLHHKQPQGNGEHFFGFWVRHTCRIWNLSLARLWRSVPIQASAGLRIVWLQPRRYALDDSYQWKRKRSRVRNSDGVDGNSKNNYNIVWKWNNNLYPPIL